MMGTDAQKWRKRTDKRGTWEAKFEGLGNKLAMECDEGTRVKDNCKISGRDILSFAEMEGSQYWEEG